MFVNTVENRFEVNFLNTATEVLRAIAHPIRISIIDLLHTHERLNVTEIHEKLSIEQAIASHHLRILKDKQVLVSDRQGKNTFYALRDPQISVIVSLLEEVLG